MTSTKIAVASSSRNNAVPAPDAPGSVAVDATAFWLNAMSTQSEPSTRSGQLEDPVADHLRQLEPLVEEHRERDARVEVPSGHIREGVEPSKQRKAEGEADGDVLGADLSRVGEDRRRADEDEREGAEELGEVLLKRIGHGSLRGIWRRLNQPVEV